MLSGMIGRRSLLSQALATVAAGASAPAFLRGDTQRSWAEMERLLINGDFTGNVSVDELPTPALVVDLDALDANIARMAAHCKASGRALRPHGKTHKCPSIAKRLIAAGAVGACAAKLGEAEDFARAGVRGILVTGASIGKFNIQRAVRLSRLDPDGILCVDHAQNVLDLDAAAKAAGIRLNLAIDLLVGNRTGIATGAPALELARVIANAKNVQLKGLQAYAGHAAHKIGFEARREMSMGIMRDAAETRRMIEADGIPCGWMSGGSTGTYNIDTEVAGVTEIQPGSFVFMDLDYARIGGKDGEVYRDFQFSLSVVTTVVSKPSPKTAVVDGGLKAFSTDKPFRPEARNLEGAVFSWGGDEHGKLDLSKASRDLAVGDRVEFVVPHCDPTVNLYDRIYGIRGRKVELAWPISGRGLSQ